MPFRSLIRFILMGYRQGWYVTRQHMLKQGYSLQAIATVLVHLLRLIEIKEINKIA